MQVSVDWLQSVHVVFTGRRVSDHAIVLIVRTRVIRCLDDVTVSLAIRAFTATDVSKLIVAISSSNTSISYQHH